MNVLIIDSGIVKHKDIAYVNILTTGFRGQNCKESIQDRNGHGTAVAGLIVKNHKALNVYVMKLFNEEFECTISDLIEALDFITKNNFYKIINMSFGITTFEFPEQIAKLEILCNQLKGQGSIIVSAFDNDGAISYPACFDSVIGVDHSNIARNKMEYEYIENSYITIKGYGANQKVSWNYPEYTIIGGTSFACANITNRIISFLFDSYDNQSIIQLLKENAISVKVFDIPKKLPGPPDWLIGTKAAILPFNKEVHSLIAYEDLLPFTISGVYDFKYMAKIGRNTSEILPYRKVFSHIIENYENMNWDSSDFDIVIAGHLGEMSWRCKTDLLGELTKLCCKHNKKLYSFDSIDSYKGRIKDDGGSMESFFCSSIHSAHIPKGRFGKLHKIISPVLAVIGTSSQQGKFTIQLELRERMLKKGYRVGQIGSEPSSLCFQMDHIFPYGYQSTVDSNGYENVLLLNQMMHDIDMKEVDICIVGAQSGTVPYSSDNLALIPLHQMEFLLGTNPDAFVLCVNPHDELSYINRTINGVESYFESKCIAIVIYPFEQEQLLGGLYQKKNIFESEKYRIFKESLSSTTNARVFDMIDIFQTEQLIECIIDFFSGS